MFLKNNLSCAFLYYADFKHVHMKNKKSAGGHKRAAGYSITTHNLRLGSEQASEA